jgi:hypothetical protein
LRGTRSGAPELISTTEALAHTARTLGASESRVASMMRSHWDVSHLLRDNLPDEELEIYLTVIRLLHVTWSGGSP